VLIDRFLEDAIEVDVDAIADGDLAIVAGLWNTSKRQASIQVTRLALFHRTACRTCRRRNPSSNQLMAKALNVKGLMNVQYAVKKEDGRPVVYVLEVNPRASRTVPFVSKAIGWPLAKSASLVMVGIPLREQGWTKAPTPTRVSVKEAYFLSSSFTVLILCWDRK